jgi:hypothetical protein
MRCVINCDGRSNSSTIDHVQAIGESLGLSVPEGANLKSRVFEDNNGYLTLATIPKMTPCTKHVASWCKALLVPFSLRTWYCGMDIVVKVDTKEQLTDTFTKGISIEPFTHPRHKLMGWASEVREGVSQGDIPIIPVTSH